MKKTLNIFMLLSMVVTLMLASCKKDDHNRPIYVATDATTILTSSATAVELSKNTSNDQVIAFSWVKPNYSFDASVTYSLEFDIPSDSFKDPIKKAVGNNILTEPYTGGDLNQIATQLKMTPDTGTIMQVRVKASVLQNGGGSVGSNTVIEDVYSEPFSIRVTPYSDVIVYPALFIAGGFQGWSDVNAIPIYSFNSDGKYEGYINVTGSDLGLKFLTTHSWSDPAYGIDGTPTTTNFTTTGSISTTGGNVTLPAVGYYRMKADENAKTFEAYQTTSWGLIGDATPGAWATETPMSYNATDNVWVIESVALTAGEFKFRANNAWDFSYGLDAAGTKLTADNGANIPLTIPGNYKVVLDLSNSTNYHYVLTKL